MFLVYLVVLVSVATIVGHAFATTVTHRRIRGAGRAGVETEGANNMVVVRLTFFVFFAISR